MGMKALWIVIDGLNRDIVNQACKQFIGKEDIEYYSFVALPHDLIEFIIFPLTESAVENMIESLNAIEHLKYEYSVDDYGDDLPLKSLLTGEIF